MSSNLNFEVDEERPAIAIETPHTSRLERSTPADFGVGYDEPTGRRIRRAIKRTSLPTVARNIFEDAGFADRREFVWQWIYYVCGETLTLPEVPDRRREAVQDTRFCAAAFTTLMDDIAEKDVDGEAYWELARAVLPGQTPDETVIEAAGPSVRAASRALAALFDRLERAPRGETVRGPLQFDLRACLVGMDHARMVAEHPGLQTRHDTWTYDTIAIGALPFFQVDLAYGPPIDETEYGQFRELLAECERLWRIANWVTTWRRELLEGDISAAIFEEAMRNDIVDRATLRAAAAGEIDRQSVVDAIVESEIPAQFIADFRRRREDLRAREFELGSYDPAGPIEAIEGLVRTHRAIEDHRLD